MAGCSRPNTPNIKKVQDEAVAWERGHTERILNAAAATKGAAKMSGLQMIEHIRHRLWEKESGAGK